MAQWLAHWTSNSKVEGSSPFKVSSFAMRLILVSLHVERDKSSNLIIGLIEPTHRALWRNG